MEATVRDQIMEIRRTGKANMLDTPAVQRLAYDMGYYELVMYIEAFPAKYVNFIISGHE